jgi:predicted amidohydrolase YtcJ
MSSLTLINTRIYTMDSRNPAVSGLVIGEGRILHTLSEVEAGQLTASREVLDLEGRILLPGLIDSHLHLQTYAETLAKIDCETSTKQECLERVAARTRKTAPGGWVLGHGWNHNLWKEGWGTALDLDQITTRCPIYLTGKSLHVSWANSRALDLAGINENTIDPPGGVIGRDENGKPTGILYEDGVKLIEKVIPPPSLDETAGAIRETQEILWKMGLTGVHDFDREPCLEALLHLEKKGQLGLRVQKSIPRSFLDTAIERGHRTGEGTDWLWFGGVKDFADGALGPQTAAMLSPYAGADSRGLLLLDEQELYELGVKAAAGGLALSIHAIGDLAIRVVLNAFERLRTDEKETGIPSLPHRIEHLQLIDPADIPRLADLGITASMQPIHATSDMDMAEAYWGERTAYAYAPRYQIDRGARVIFGSDAPVESPNPWLGIHAAVTRRRADGNPGPDGWHPEGRLSLAETLEAFTVSPALAADRGDRLGRLAPGYFADLIALDRDPFTCSPDELREIQPAGTMIAGKWVFKDF